MITREIEEMFKLQDRLNTHTNGDLWHLGMTNKEREINWYRCIYMECAEAIDSFNWKHWKDINSRDDIENLKIEVVDIWHFVMSQIISDYGSATVALAELHEGEHTPFLFSNAIEALEKMMKNALDQNVDLALFFGLVEVVPDFDMNDVYKLYIGKNCLNQFRQDNGYKEGNYIKTWHGEEDNVLMQRLLSQKADITFDSLYDGLSDIYKTVKE